MDSQWIGIGSLVLAVLVFLYGIGRDIKNSIAASEARTGGLIAASEARTGGLIAASEARLTERIDAVKDHSDKRIDDLHAVVVAGFAQANAQLSVLETRTYEIGRALPPPASAESQAS